MRQEDLKMLDVATLLQLDLFSNFTLCAGALGLVHNISNVVVLDHEGLLDNFSDFHEGDFVLTNLFYAKDDPERIYTSFCQLMQIGVSAIAIKSIFYKELPEKVLALANRKNVPVFFFQDIYIEDVILCITDYIRSSTDYSRYEQLIDTILCAIPEQDALHELLSGMAAEPFSFVSCLYLSYRKKMDALSIQRYLNKLQIRRNSLAYCLRFHSANIKTESYFSFLWMSPAPCLHGRQYCGTSMWSRISLISASATAFCPSPSLTLPSAAVSMRPIVLHPVIFPCTAPLPSKIWFFRCAKTAM